MTTTTTSRPARRHRRLTAWATLVAIATLPALSCTASEQTTPVPLFCTPGGYVTLQATTTITPTVVEPGDVVYLDIAVDISAIADAAGTPTAFAIELPLPDQIESVPDITLPGGNLTGSARLNGRVITASFSGVVPPTGDTLVPHLHLGAVVSPSAVRGSTVSLPSLLRFYGRVSFDPTLYVDIACTPFFGAPIGSFTVAP